MTLSTAFAIVGDCPINHVVLVSFVTIQAELCACMKTDFTVCLMLCYLCWNKQIDSEQFKHCLFFLIVTIKLYTSSSEILLKFSFLLSLCFVGCFL